MYEDEVQAEAEFSENFRPENIHFCDQPVAEHEHCGHIVNYLDQAGEYLIPGLHKKIPVTNPKAALDG